MPLAFSSLSHGEIAFGFFNIDTDLLLLERYFIFAPEFCRYIKQIAGHEGEESVQATWEAFQIPREHMGDLMGAIHRIRLTGFIGEVYCRFPFPLRQEDFKQQPEGFQNRRLIQDILERYSTPLSLPFTADRQSSTVRIGEYVFTTRVFQDLIDYVWLGGYPRWRDNIRPDYVLSMKGAVEMSRSWLFDGPIFTRQVGQAGR